MTEEHSEEMRIQHLEAEKVIAHGVRETAAELRLIDLDMMLAHIMHARHDTLNDIVDSATEMYFQPGALRFNRQCSVLPSWTAAPVISLAMVMRHSGMLLLFDLGLAETHAFVRMRYLYCDAELDVQSEMALRLQRMFDAVRLAQPGSLFREAHGMLEPVPVGSLW